MKNIANRIHKSGPIFSGKSFDPSFEGLNSNELWYSVYSEEKDYVFESQTLNKNCVNPAKLNKNIYPGKYYDEKNDNYKNISAVVYYGPDGLLIYENPFATKKISYEFYRMISSGRWFKIESSRINFPDNKLLDRLNNDKEILASFYNEKFYEL